MVARSRRVSLKSDRRWYGILEDRPNIIPSGFITVIPFLECNATTRGMQTVWSKRMDSRKKKAGGRTQIRTSLASRAAGVWGRRGALRAAVPNRPRPARSTWFSRVARAARGGQRRTPTVRGPARCDDGFDLFGWLVRCSQAPRQETGSVHLVRALRVRLDRFCQYGSQLSIQFIF
jgi:hypothetical protein